jgi:hypothetical protein
MTHREDPNLSATDESYIDESFNITRNPAADVFSSTYIEPGIFTTSKSGSNLTPKSRRITTFPVNMPIDVRLQLNIERQRMQRGASQKRS